MHMEIWELLDFTQMTGIGFPRRGFSLVELSIVLVILGLLVGGVLSGQSLIHAAQLRAVTTEMNNYVSAYNTFRDKYMAIPGDMNNATKFWNIADGDGDGDGKICENAGCTVSWRENEKAWEHLDQAGLVQGVTSLTLNQGGHYADAPASRFGNAVWSMSYDCVFDNSCFNPPNIGNMLELGSGVAPGDKVALNISNQIVDGEVVAVNQPPSNPSTTVLKSR